MLKGLPVKQRKPGGSLPQCGKYSIINIKLYKYEINNTRISKQQHYKMKTKLSSNQLKNENSKQHKCWNYHEYGHCVKECPKRESTKPQISKSKKRRDRYHTIIRQKDTIIDQQKFLIDAYGKRYKKAN